MAYKVAFYKATSSNILTAIQQWAIRIWTRGRYSHCELIEDNGSNDPSNWTWMGASSYNSGLTIARTIEYKEDHWDIFDLPGDVDYTPSTEWVIKNTGLKYDWRGIWLSQFLGLNIDKSNRYFCSEFNMKSLQKTSLLRGDTARPESYSPNGMYRKFIKMDALKVWLK